MPFLVIAGITVGIEEGGATKRIDRIGTSERAFAGNLRSAIRAEKRVWDVVTGLMTNANANTLEAAIDFAEQVVCSGDALGGSITCEVTVNDEAYIAVNGGDGLGFMRALKLTLREV